MRPDAAFQRRVLRVFEDMLDQPPVTRGRWLDDVCGDEPALRAAVLAMSEADAALRLLPTLPPEPSDGREDGPMPERIGRYRIIRELGRGGMGVVYLGERDDGLFEHRVAIKLMRRTLLSERALARFATERRILAKLRHPHIAQMLDGGLTPDGGSYIVMELIGGQAITKYCAEHRASLVARLDLFMQMAEAVEHAHRNLIVHADIKPSNIVVEQGFGVKLLDFGVARLLDDGEDGRHEGYTPGYASPARIGGEPATPADDVYAAGRLLDELVDGQANVDDQLRAVVAKATAAEPDFRYGAMSELADDLDRWRTSRPVRAVPAGRRKRALLFWRRHRIAVAATSAIVTVVLVALVLTTTAWLQASRARGLAERRYAEAREMSGYLLDDVTAGIAPLPGSSAIRERIAIRAERGLEQLGGAAGSEKQMGLDDSLASVEVGEILAVDGREGLNPDAPTKALHRAETGLPPLIARYPDRTDLPILLARAYVADAWLASHVRNDPVAALRLIDRADVVLDGPTLRFATTSRMRDIRWDAALARAYALDAQSDDQRTNIPLLEAALRRAAPPVRPVDAGEALRLNRTRNMLGDAYWYSGHKGAGLRQYDLALAALGASLLDRDTRIVQQRASEQYQIASTLSDLGRYPAALDHVRDGLDIIIHLRTFDDTPAVQHLLDVLQNEYGSELTAVGRYAEGIAQMRASIAGAEALARAQPLNYYDQREVPVSLRPLAESYLKAGRRRQACAAVDQAMAGWTLLAGRWRLGRYDGVYEKQLLRALHGKCAGSVA